ncbi:uncharacterized protein LOC111024102 [Momordica charantia]|uniref:Uncharacterized protein LOC111024102 n=1 Tax=Momordica charantia TaxID=3673 RepID=A0A6J1DT89_MOMCH|nr:uncharacterized protein LOC111024102 [Momordica charantia]
MEVIYHISQVSTLEIINCHDDQENQIRRFLWNKFKQLDNRSQVDLHLVYLLGRRIVDNILLCQELVDGYHLNKGVPGCVLKVDLQKAYDSVHWNFLSGTLFAIGTPPRFVNWIWAYITSPMFLVSLNGALEGYFPGCHGLRQGDPLSPYLFVMVMELLSRMLNRPLSVFRFHQKCEKVGLAHLCFADDLMIFSHGDLGSLSFIKDVLVSFGVTLVGGPCCEYSEDSSFGAGLPNVEVEQLVAFLGFSVGLIPVHCLGVPLLSHRLSHRDCQPLLARIVSRVWSSSAQVLSFVGRLQLIRSVL